jgi:cytochrome c nitrite reductase small subunit
LQESLGPLFVPPSDPHYLGWLVAAVVLVAAAVAAVGLVRGRLRAAGAWGLVALPVFAYVLGTLFVMQESKRVEFCGSCHEVMSPVVESISTDAETLAGMHWSRGAVSHGEACYTCHSGYGIWGEANAKRAGLRHMWHTLTGHFEFPLKTAGPFDVQSCLGCHAGSDAFRAAEDHQDLELQKALLSGEIGCTGECHEPAHPESALNGVAAAQ